jgi:superfamily I DNA/RNA helicase
LASELIFGPPGCGKTYTLIQRFRDALARGIAPYEIGYVSFTNKSIDEALMRIVAEFGLTKKDMPFVKTLHALCFHGLGLTRGDVMGNEDYAMLGRMLGLNFKGTTSVDDDWHMPGEAFHDDYVRIYDRSRLRMVSLEQEFREAGSYDLFYPALLQVAGTLDNYKSANNKLDFTDMLSVYLKIGQPPRLKLLIVDEAQDLTPLQWAVVRRMQEFAQHTCFAGDDDQAIHAWAGVDVKLFLEASDNYQVLEQSYRLPKTVHALADRIVRRIDVRQPKLWRPTDREGSVNFHMDRHTVPLDKGSWTIMARTNFQVSELANELREDGYFFQRGSQRSVSLELSVAIDVWDRLGKGETVSKDEAKSLMKRLPKTGRKQALSSGAMAALDTGDPEVRYDLSLLQSDYGLLVCSGGVEVFALSPDEEMYIRSLQRRGTNLLAPPDIKIATIHAMKGGEDENVMLLTDSTRNCMTSPDQDNEHRIIYVGITRAKENLHVIESSRKYRYII